MTLAKLWTSKQSAHSFPQAGLFDKLEQGEHDLQPTYALFLSTFTEICQVPVLIVALLIPCVFKHKSKDHYVLWSMEGYHMSIIRVRSLPRRGTLTGICQFCSSGKGNWNIKCFERAIMQVSLNRTKIQSPNKQLAQRKCCSMMMMWARFLRKAHHDVIAVRLFTSVLLGLHSKTLWISTHSLQVVKTFLPRACNRMSFGSLKKECHCEQVYIKSSAVYGSAANNPAHKRDWTCRSTQRWSGVSRTR